MGITCSDYKSALKCDECICKKHKPSFEEEAVGIKLLDKYMVHFGWGLSCFKGFTIAELSRMVSVSDVFDCYKEMERMGHLDSFFSQYWTNNPEGSFKVLYFMTPLNFLKLITEWLLERNNGIDAHCFYEIH